MLTTRADCALTSVCRVVVVVNRRSAQPDDQILIGGNNSELWADDKPALIISVLNQSENIGFHSQIDRFTFKIYYPLEFPMSQNFNVFRKKS